VRDVRGFPSPLLPPIALPRKPGGWGWSPTGRSTQNGVCRAEHVGRGTPPPAGGPRKAETLI